ncbi:MarR family transcriptional regulator [Paenibacillus sp.]|jgi:DNA-binding MarR family transcriptional regulator|uniref:MarR family winged helix-turn-helix transcriptional regulator n=1 Tax=Paenibacillus sp. TaxID=58172 RepID=UPI00282EE392|nr:MarR family transcriptional regulator [Paenibacillus sp.]MDR0267089.1 MarR family transcriptional regulator [Paenibacillus sp.]
MSDCSSADKSTALKLMQATLRFNKAEFRHRKIEGIKMSELGLLFTIKKNVKPGTTGLMVSEISNILRVTSPTVTQVIKSLEKKDWVVRTMDEVDRRAVRINLTEEGEKVVQKAIDSTIESFAGLIEYLGEEDGNRLADLLTKAYTYYESKVDLFGGGAPGLC